jgi:hypothetical protein
MEEIPARSGRRCHCYAGGKHRRQFSQPGKKWLPNSRRLLVQSWNALAIIMLLSKADLLVPVLLANDTFGKQGAVNGVCKKEWVDPQPIVRTYSVWIILIRAWQLMTIPNKTGG